ncbi:MAG: hypothetical protein JSV04_14810 [Candidatus Heimdallarchaeota archaeon]|nr:MAG: hypothetical protein JSV04_14810 [Candidatus Heimdallarchaeota archaeon]
MPNEPRKIEIETFKTPKGDVPTVKGLETTINTVYAEMSSLGNHLTQISHAQNQISESLSKLSNLLIEYNKKIETIGESFANLVVHLAKIESQQLKNQELSRKKLIIEKADLVALKEDLSRILIQLQNHVNEK